MENRRPQPLHVLIVTNEAALGTLWQRHLERSGAVVEVTQTQDGAIDLLDRKPVDIVILNMALEGGSALAVADYAGFRCPGAKIISVTNSNFFSGGSVFALLPNVCAQVTPTTPPDDIAAMVEHFGKPDQS